MIYHSKYTKDGRILLERDGVLLNFDKTVCTDSPELISSDEYYTQFIKPKQDGKYYKQQYHNLETIHYAILDKANDKLIHGL